jgi:hypothetical protein
MLDGRVGRSPSAGHSLMMATHAVWAVVVALFVLGFAVGKRTVLRGNFGGQDQSVRIEWYDDWPKRYAWLGFPAPGSERVEYRKLARETCAAQSVASLAWALETRATPGAIARRYARWSGELDPAVYEGCLAGFREGR